MFCYRPFKDLYVDIEGDCYLCCPLWMSRKAGNVLKTSIVDIWHGADASDLRVSILDQSFRYCRNCGNKGCVTQNVTPYDLNEIGTLTLGHDQSCNLTCPSCRLSAKSASPKATAIDQAVFSSGVLKTVRCLNLGGNGDPFASLLFRKLLKELPSMDCHPDLRLSLQTNGLLLTPEMLAEVQATGKPVDKLLISVDAANADTYRMVRGGDWDVLMKNLFHLGHTGLFVQLNFVVQELNFKEIVAFVELAVLLGAKVAYFSALENWDTYAVEDYAKRAVHVPAHSRHAELLGILRSPELHGRTDIRVNLTNLKFLLGRETP
jgi:MoaA/NifB/PqqE/SkfB family radical SAM enzyme